MTVRTSSSTLLRDTRHVNTFAETHDTHDTVGSGISIQFADEVAALEILDRSDAAKIAVAKS